MENKETTRLALYWWRVLDKATRAEIMPYESNPSQKEIVDAYISITSPPNAMEGKGCPFDEPNAFNPTPKEELTLSVDAKEEAVSVYDKEQLDFEIQHIFDSGAN